MPDALVVALHRKLLGEHVAELRLVNHHKVDIGIVVIHQQIVAQELPRGVGMQLKAPTLILDAQTNVQHIALVVALMVLVGVEALTCCLIDGEIRIGLLLDELIVGNEIEGETLGGLIHQTQASTSLVHIVGRVVSERIAIESLLSVVESGKREGKLIVELAIVRHFDIAIESGAYAKTDISALIAEGVLGIHTNHTALGVESIEGALRTTQDVNTLHLIEMTVEGRLVHQRHIIDIDTHRGTVYTRADASHIDRRRET